MRGGWATPFFWKHTSWPGRATAAACTCRCQQSPFLGHLGASPRQGCSTKQIGFVLPESKRRSERKRLLCCGAHAQSLWERRHATTAALREGMRCEGAQRRGKDTAAPPFKPPCGPCGPGERAAVVKPHPGSCSEMLRGCHHCMPAIAHACIRKAWPTCTRTAGGIARYTPAVCVLHHNGSSAEYVRRSRAGGCLQNKKN